MIRGLAVEIVREVAVASYSEVAWSVYCDMGVGTSKPTVNRPHVDRIPWQVIRLQRLRRVDEGGGPPPFQIGRDDGGVLRLPSFSLAS